jgi:transcriptional regulator with PAS, ATPase and Fis domain
MEKMLRMPDVDVKTYFITSRAQLEDAVIQAKNDGVDVVVCGPTGCIAAERIGCHSVMIKTHRQEIWHALTEAKRSAYVYNVQKLETERFKNISDYSFDGILTVDQNQSIVSYNNAAQELLLGSVSENRVAERLAAVMRQPGMQEIFVSDQAYTDEIIDIGGKNLSVNSIPVMVRGEKRGKVIIFQDATRIQKIESEIRKKMHARGHVARYTLDDMIGESEAMRECKRIAREYSAVNSTILITGGTGTGKEMFAQGIHNASRRSKGPFVAVNCAAIPDNLLESELFGYVSGAFTGAAKGGKMGYFELAHKGTIFLDEISEIPLTLQGRLLRTLQEKEIVKVGDDKVTPIDVRIIAASNRDLQQISEEGGFRQDLYYRLDVLRISLPSLGARREDIPLLAEHFIERFKQHFSRPDIDITEGALLALSELDWKGNIRQLSNICERLVVVCPGRIIGVEDIAAIEAERSGAAEKLPAAFESRMARAERSEILRLLNAHNGNKDEVAHALDISRATLYRKLKKHDINGHDGHVSK